MVCILECDLSPKPLRLVCSCQDCVLWHTCHAAHEVLAYCQQHNLHTDHGSIGIDKATAGLVNHVTMQTLSFV